MRFSANDPAYQKALRLFFNKGIPIERALDYVTQKNHTTRTHIEQKGTVRLLAFPFSWSGWFEAHNHDIEHSDSFRYFTIYIRPESGNSSFDLEVDLGGDVSFFVLTGNDTIELVGTSGRYKPRFRARSHSLPEQILLVARERGF